MTAPLVTHAPLALIALSPLARNLLLASQAAPLLPLMLVAASRRAIGSLVGYKLGAAYGQRAIGMMEVRAPRATRLIRMFERLFRRADVLVSFLVPRGSAVVAGVAGMDPKAYMLASTAGHAFWSVITYLVGDWLSDHIKLLLVLIRQYMLEITFGFIALAALQVLIHRMRTKGRALPW